VPFLLTINTCMEPVITAFTLVDVTATGIIKGESLLRDQQRNWETVLQVLGLKTQPIIINSGTPVNKFLNSDGSTYSSYNHSAWSNNYANGSFITTLKPAGTPPRISLGLVNASNFATPAEYSVTFTITPINF